MSELTDSLADTVEAGPVDYLVVEFPGDRRTGEGLPLLVDLVDRRVIRLLDLVFIRRDLDGSVTEIAVTDLDGDGTLDLAVFHGASSGLIAADDVDAAGSVLEPGCSAAVVVYENLWAAPLMGALTRSGARLVASGRIPPDALVEALGATEPGVAT